MANLLQKLVNASVSRRDFLKGSMAATAAIAALGLVGCQDVKETDAPETKAQGEDAPSKEVSPEHTPIVDIEEGGKWISAACWHNCGGRCMNKVMVKDGAVVRQKTDDTHEDSFDYPQQRGCVRGKAQQQQCFGADRIKYPLKRKHWQPGGVDFHGEMRGIDEWERISWDEAIKYVADEYKRIKDAYGNQAFVTGSWGSYTENIPLMYFGGHTSVADSTSYGTFLLNTHKTVGVSQNGFGANNDRYDMLNADVMVFLSLNPAWSAPGTPINHFVRAKEAGVKFICIDPMYSETAQALDAEWVPVRTGTDTALLLGVAAEMLRLDPEENLIDWDFLDKYTVGFDAEHTAPNMKENVHLKGYLAGEYDGVVKDAAWASNICGTPVELITMLARTFSKQNNVWFLHSFAAARNDGAENLPQLIMTIGAMGGHMGKKGNNVSLSYTHNSANGGDPLVKGGGTGLPYKGDNGVPGIIPGPQVWDAVLTGKYRMIGDYYGYTAEGLGEGRDMTCDIHCITNVDEHAYLQTGPNMKAGIEAHRKVDFVVSKAQFMTTPAKYSDIILPVNTYWERPGGLASSNREFLFCYSQVTESLWESKSDQEIDKLIMEALGLDPLAAYPISEKQQFFNAIAGCTVVKPGTATAGGAGATAGYDPYGNPLSSSMEYETLVTITQEDIDAWGVEGTPQEGRVSLQEFIDNGGYQVERSVDDEFCGHLGYASYINDPENNPLATASGKWEITSQTKADFFNGFGYIDWDYKPYPEYILPTTGYETTFKDGKIGGEKGEYPYLLFNIHYIRRCHSTFDNCSWLREAHANPVFLNASDAKALGIENGDTVLITTKTAQALRKACCMQGLMPGQVGIPHGAWADIDEETGIDKAGADNYLLGNEISGSGVTPYNNINCKIEKYSGPALEDDYLWPARIIDVE